MPANTTRTLLLGCAMAVAALTAAAAGGPEPIPTGASKQASASKQPAASTNGAAAEQTATGQGQAAAGAEADAGASDEAQSAPARPAANAFVLARWVRAIGGRVCVGPKIARGDRISRPNPADANQGWRVSIPSFASARVSAPPARAHAAARETANETPADPSATETGTNQTETAAVTTDG